MPVNSPHPDYLEAKDSWETCRDVLAGQRAVKEAGERYLPRLSEQTQEEYDAYRQRALFLGATGRTLEGLLGALLRKEPQIEASESFQESLESIGRRRQSFGEVARFVASEVLSTGRLGLFVDAPAEESTRAFPFFSTYRAESILSWREAEVDGRLEPDRVVLLESYLGPNLKDPWAFKRFERIRVLVLENAESDERFVRVEVHVPKEEKGKWILESEIVPRARGGRPLRRIPFVFFGVTCNEAEIDDPPLLDLAEVNLSHYRNSADLEHGAHWTALPQPYVTGVDPEKTKLGIGSTQAWALPLGAEAAFAEFSGKGLGFLSNLMEGKRGQMAILGSRLLDESRPGVEAADTLRLRQSGEDNALSSVSKALSDGFTEAFGFIRDWRGGDGPAGGEDASAVFSTDFDPTGVSPQMLTALVALVQSNLMSWPTFFEAIRKGELIPPGRTIEEEARMILAGLPGGGLGIGSSSDPEPEPEPVEDDESGDGEE